MAMVNGGGGGGGGARENEMDMLCNSTTNEMKGGKVVRNGGKFEMAGRKVAKWREEKSLEGISTVPLRI